MKPATEAPEGFVAPPFIGDANTRHGPRPSAVMVEVMEGELGRHESDTTATSDIVLAVHRTARFLSEAIVGGHADQNDVAAYLALVARATDPQPKACFEDAENFAFRLNRGARKVTEGTP